MAVFNIRDPQTGRTIKLRGDSPPTEQELIEIFATVGGQDGNNDSAIAGSGDAGVQPRETRQQRALKSLSGLDPGEGGLLDQFGRVASQALQRGLVSPALTIGDLLSGESAQEAITRAGERARAFSEETQEGGFVPPAPSITEPLLSIATGAIAEPIAGLAGVAQAVNPFAEAGAGGTAVESAQQALTFQPRTAAGQEALGAVGEVVAPVAKALTGLEEALGGNTLELTGSPALAAAAATIPTALMEVLGIKGTKGVRGIKRSDLPKPPISESKLFAELSEAAPTIDQLKTTTRGVYKEIDDLGVTLKPAAYSELTRRLRATTKDAGIDPDITPKSSKALRRFEALDLGDVTSEVTLTELDNLRKVAQNAAKSLEPAESAIGVAMIDTVDNFLDKLPASGFRRAEGDVGEISSRYRTARDLWGRARRSELMQDAFDKAKNQASGFENGIRTQFRSILNSKKQRRFFKPNEIKLLERVVRGDKKVNMAKLVGRFALSEGVASNPLTTLGGIAAGGVAGGGVGAVIVPIIGQVSRKLAQRMTVRSADFLDAVIRSGNDAEQIVRSYLEHTPKAKRTAGELSELLMRPEINLNQIPDSVLSRQAVQLANQRRAELGAAAAPAALEPLRGDEQ